MTSPYGFGWEGLDTKIWPNLLFETVWGIAWCTEMGRWNANREARWISLFRMSVCIQIGGQRDSKPCRCRCCVEGTLGIANVSSFFSDEATICRLFEAGTVSFAFNLELAFEKLPFFRDEVSGVADTGFESLPFGGADEDGLDDESLLCLVMLCGILEDAGAVQLLDKELISWGLSFFRVESRKTTGRSMVHRGITRRSNEVLPGPEWKKGWEIR